MDTIFATATALGKSGVAIVRVSGPRAWDAGTRLAGNLPAPGHAALRRLSDDTGGALDDALVLCFKKGASFTGEDVVEFHLHGSVAILSVVLKSLGTMTGLRMAEPGEFTRRALENGCLDLTQVEGLGDLIEAETEAQRVQALRIFEGALGEKVGKWRRNLIRAAALIEATIDFSEEEDLFDVIPQAAEITEQTLIEIERETEGGKVSERIREGFEVAIVGPPNVGKSTLLNRLAGRDAAITSEVAGTTRDVIEVRMDLGGLPVTLLDTAGLRESEDLVEKLGVSRALRRAESADLRIFLSDRNGAMNTALKPSPDDIIVQSKADLLHDNKKVAVSGLTGEGVDGLIESVRRKLEIRASGAGMTTRVRQRAALLKSCVSLRAAIDGMRSSTSGPELLAADLNMAIRALESVVGKIDVEHLLDEIFASFCLGK
ncbi:MAG: tRNA uridine-5-carboxymethylaminomethyl(34) synthesis GTPase MnmE [Paracoccaceae bacterium]